MKPLQYCRKNLKLLTDVLFYNLYTKGCLKALCGKDEEKVVTAYFSVKLFINLS
jgi:hypothetical protein